MKVIKEKKAFTLLELSVIIVIIGIFVVFAIPKYKDALERPKIQEAFDYLSSVKSAQEKYFQREGVYAEDLSDLDVSREPLKYFSIEDVVVDEESWRVRLVRRDSKLTQGYTIVFDQNGFNEDNSTIPENVLVGLNQINKEAVVE